MSVEMGKHAVLSDDGLYRYSLLREWEAGKPSMTFVMLNPSTADASVDDPTIRRCIAFARREGCGQLLVFNLYAWRATDPKALARAADPVGEENDVFLRGHFLVKAEFGEPVVAAWGANAGPDRVAQVRALVPGVEFVCLGETKDGHPRHPLYVRGNQPLVPWGVAS